METKSLITKEEVVQNWGIWAVALLVDILNKEYPLEEAIEDIKSFRKEEVKKC